MDFTLFFLVSTRISLLSLLKVRVDFASLANDIHTPKSQRQFLRIEGVKKKSGSVKSCAMIKSLQTRSKNSKQILPAESLFKLVKPSFFVGSQSNCSILQLYRDSQPCSNIHREHLKFPMTKVCVVTKTV